MAVPLIYVDRSTAGDHEVCKDTDQEFQDLVRLQVQWASSSGNASSPWTRGALQWLLSQFLRCSFCEICGNELERLPLIAQGQKSLFPHWPALYHLFYYHIYWYSDTQKEHLGFYVHPSMTHHFYCCQDCTQECIGTWKMNGSSPRVSTWEASQKATLLHSGWHQRKSRNHTKVLMVRN